MIDFGKLGGLVPVIIQDVETKDVLMLGFMNEEAWQRTISTGKVWYHSRKRNTLWMKGEQSGHYQFVRNIYLDCDNDTLLIEVAQLGGACDLGFRTCFEKRYSNGTFLSYTKQVFNPADVYPVDESLSVAIPSGSLSRQSLALVNAAFSITACSAGETLVARLPANDSDVSFRPANPRAIPGLVAEGKVDIGVTGLDWVLEIGAKVVPVARLGFNKAGRGPALWALLAPESSPVTHVSELTGTTIVTELQAVASNFLVKHGVTANIVECAATGAHNALFSGNNYAIDLIETGDTARSFRYRPLFPVLETEAVLIANPQSYGYTWKRRRMEELTQLLLGAVDNIPVNPRRLFSFDGLPLASKVSLQSEWETLRMSWFLATGSPARGSSGGR